MVATMGRQVYEQAEAKGHTAALEAWGVEFVTDTCWCMLGDVVPYPPVVNATTLVTNSGKYAHYAPGLVNRGVRYTDLAGCVAAARTGRVPPSPRWLQQSRSYSTSRSIGHTHTHGGQAQGHAVAAAAARRGVMAQQARRFRHALRLLR